MYLDRGTLAPALHPHEAFMLREIFDTVLIERQWSRDCEAARALATRIADLHRRGLQDTDDLLTGHPQILTSFPPSSNDVFREAFSTSLL